MSAINDALKKTQSALNIKSTAETSAFISIDPPKQPLTEPARLERLIEWLEESKETVIVFLTNKFFIGAISGLLLLSVSIPVFHHLSQFVQYKKVALQKIQKSKTLPITTIEQPVNLMLNGTIHADGKRDAMINNQLYRVGDRINDYKILEIQYNQVTLLNTKTQKTIMLTTELS